MLNLDPNEPLWPLPLFGILGLGVPWLIEVIGGWL